MKRKQPIKCNVISSLFYAVCQLANENTCSSVDSISISDHKSHPIFGHVDGKRLFSMRIQLKRNSTSSSLFEFDFYLSLVEISSKSDAILHTRKFFTLEHFVMCESFYVLNINQVLYREREKMNQVHWIEKKIDEVFCSLDLHHFGRR